MPTEYGANQYVNELYNIRETIDGIELPFITGLSFKHKVNSSRVATVTLENREALEMLRVGAVVTIDFGLSDAYANKEIRFEEIEMNHYFYITTTNDPYISDSQ